MKIEKVERLIANLNDKSECFIHIKNLKQVLNHGLVMKNVQIVIKFNQKSWLNPYIGMNTDLRKAAKIGFVKDFWKLMNNSDFDKTMANVMKDRDIKLVATEKSFGLRTKLPNYKVFHITLINK